MANFVPDRTPLWKFLDLDRDFTTDEVEAAYDSTWQPDDDRFVAWNVLHDRWYGALYRREPSLEAVIDAGFVLENTTSREYRQYCSDSRLMTLPFDKLDFDDSMQKPVIVLSTGGFYPVHEGHLTMMEKARDILENAGYDIVGGYMSLSHEGYISTKPYYVDKPFERFKQCRDVLKESNWIMADPWESLYIGVPVNFTDVIDQLACRIRKYLGRDIDIAYVFGADNASFAKCFEEEGIAICVERDGYEDGFEQVKHLAEKNSRIFAAANKADSAKIASRDYRAHMKPIPTDMDEDLFLLRDEKASPLSCISEFIDNTEDYQNEFLAQLSCIIENGFDGQLAVQIEDLNAQLKRYQSEEFNLPTLSLDPFCQGDFNLGISRSFCTCSGEENDQIFTRRPESPALNEQLADLPEGKYVLIDDDSFTGSTVSFVKGLLPEGSKIASTFFLAEYDRDRVADLADARDFIIGAELGGLVGFLPDGTLIRMPYLLPYADVSARMSMSPDNALPFSLETWLLNARMLEAHAPALEIKDIPIPTRQLFLYAGFDPEMPVFELCYWHAEHLKATQSANTNRMP